MILVERTIKNSIKQNLFKGKVVVIYGARQVGKTTLTKQILEEYKGIGLYLNCEILSVQQGLEIPEPEKLKSFLGDYKLIILDEAQKIKNIGLILKLLVDTYPELQIIATGSSSFDLANKTSEPLTGRIDQYILYPFSVEELLQGTTKIQMSSKIETLLRFGAYPEIYFLNEQEARGRLNEISSNYLYKDILNFEKIKKSGVLINLLQLLALQIGHEVSFSEIASNLGINRLTVQKYIDMLEQFFVIFTLRSFSRNMRKEISKSVKVYFYDLGIRNSLIQNFNKLEIRNDLGGLWENFLIVERLKKCSYHNIFENRYFWRTYDQKEIDYVEEREGKLHTFEFKWGNAKAKQIPEFIRAYPDSEFMLINRDNFWEFIL